LEYQKIHEKLYALNIKSNALLKLEQYDESERIIDNILNEDPESESALANKATIISEYGNYHEAIVYYENSLEIYNKKISEYNSKKTKINMLLNEKIDIYVLSEIWVNKGKAHYKLKETTNALECFNKALKLNSKYDEAKKAKEEIIPINRQF
jgi:tetratricopeptide (TPR) repeat protein